MAVSSSTPLTYTNMPVHGVVVGNPDGIFSGTISSVGDATGGSNTAALLIGASGAEPLDVVYAVDNWFVKNLHSAQIATVRLALINGLLLGATSFELFSSATLAATTTIRGNVAQPLYRWTQKGDSTTLIQLQADNLDTANMRLSVQGRYWYMGPRRLAAFEASR